MMMPATWPMKVLGDDDLASALKIDPAEYKKNGSVAIGDAIRSHCF